MIRSTRSTATPIDGGITAPRGFRAAGIACGIKRNGKPEPFTLVGRAQYKSTAGSWSEWVAALSNGELAWLSEDNGSFVFAVNWQPPGWNVTEFQQREWRMGRELKAGTESFTVTSIQDAQLMAAQGELPQLPQLGKSFKLSNTFVDLFTSESFTSWDGGCRANASR